MLDKKFWKNKRVLLTGHTGFKGSWTSIMLHKLGAKLHGISLEPITNPNLFEIANIQDLFQISLTGDVNCKRDIDHLISEVNPDIVLHMAAQPLVKYSYENPIETFATNIMGTVNLLESCKRNKSVKSIVIITSDKCYENLETGQKYNENDKLGGLDPYSSSKACAEIVTNSYAKSYFMDLNVGIGSARAGNVIGGGDWSKDRLVPDIFKSIEKDEAVILRNPNSTRPWQHVIEPIYGYLLLAERLYFEPKKYTGAWNFGPYKESSLKVIDIVSKIQENWDSEIELIIENSQTLHEASNLDLDVTKSVNKLEWLPRWNIHETISNITSWYKSYKKNKDPFEICSLQIDKYFGGKI